VQPSAVAVTSKVLPDGFPQPFHVAQRRQAEEPLVVPAKACGIVVPHAIAGTRRVETLADHQLAGFLKSYLLLVLQGAHRGDGSRVVVEARYAHAKLLGNVVKWNNHPMRKTWPFVFYFLLFAGVASSGPYRVLYYQSQSLTGAQIGLLVGIAPLITMVSLPLVTGLADRTNKHGLIMGLSLLVMVSVQVLFPYLKTFILLFGIAVLSSVLFSPIMPLSTSATMFMLEDRKDLYGRMRLGGTIGFSIVATVTGALVENHGLRIAFWGAAALFFITFLVGQKLVHGEKESEKPAQRGRASDLLRNPHFLLFLLIGLSGGISFATINTYLFPYMKELGAGESAMGLALTIGTIVEIPVLFFANRFIKRFGAYVLLVFSVAMTGLRFLLLAIAPNPVFVLFVQLLNGLNFPLLSVAGVTYADEHAPKGFRATAQGLFNASTGGIGSAIGGFAGGLLFESIGSKGMYFTLCTLLVLVLVFVHLVRRTLSPEEEVSYE
jgi:PPP family 3-phenylpropionic acid transporter